MRNTITLIVEGADESVAAEIDTTAVGDAIWLVPAAFEAATGWRLEPDGLCRDALCVPVRDRSRLSDGARIELTAAADLLNRPFVVDRAAGLAVLGEAAEDRSQAQAALVVPDIELPTLDGADASVRDFDGMKRLLLAWASW